MKAIDCLTSGDIAAKLGQKAASVRHILDTHRDEIVPVHRAGPTRLYTKGDVQLVRKIIRDREAAGTGWSRRPVTAA